MTQAALDVLGTSCAEIENEDGADTPRMVVAILPVEEAEFPIATSAVPPFTCGVAVFVSVFIQLCRFIFPSIQGVLIIRK